MQKSLRIIIRILTLWAALAAATATDYGHRHTAECAGDRQELLAVSSSLLEDRRILSLEVTRLKEALEDAQQGYLRVENTQRF